jgi:3-hydroxyisobutyrate dehydrogenase-like beta-hydroxyacid dehydrogenase
MRPTVGWVGLGNIGMPMACRVHDAGFALRVWARRAEAAQPLLDRGAHWSDSPEALARESDVLVTIVAGPDDVLALHRRMLPQAKRAVVVLEMTTASPATALALHSLSTHAEILDCPVTGGVAGAREGKLTSFVGGNGATLSRARPVLETLSQRIVHCGDAGSGYRMKLVNQAMIAGVLLGLAQGSALARASGFTGSQLVEALGQGTASGVLFHSYVARMIEPGGAETFALGMLRKDLRLARDESVASGIDSAFLELAIARVDRACARFGEHAGVQFLAADLRYNDAVAGRGSGG